MKSVEITIPALGDFDTVEVIEIHVAAGDVVQPEDPLVSLETDKATMDVPAPQGGRVLEILVATGSTVAAGDPIILLEPDEAAEVRPAGGPQAAADIGTPAAAPVAAAPHAAAATAAAQPMPGATEAPGPRLVVIGAGPGGYTAAFRAADLGLEVTLVERWPTLGGVCLNVGCIPSKALLHAAGVIAEAEEMRDKGVAFGTPEIDAARLVGWKNSVIGQLTQGLTGLAAKRGVRVIEGYARFAGPQALVVETAAGSEVLEFDQCIIAAGSEPFMIPGLPDDERIVDSSGALELDPLPARMLVIGGGIIGLEMATVYAALGVRVSIAELTDTLIPGCDRDLVRPLQKKLEQRCEAIMTGTGATAVTSEPDGIRVAFEGRQAPETSQLYDRVLVAVGRRPNGAALDIEKAGISPDSRGYISVDGQMRTAIRHIFAIGDIVGNPMLAHKATHEGRVAAEAAAGHKVNFDARVIPSVAYTDPEVAWVGLTETHAAAEGMAIDKGIFPWAASGRALSLGRTDGMTKLIIDPATRRVLGVGIVGPHAGDLIAEAGLAIEMGCDAEDIGLTIHPHPTLSETMGFAAEAAEGTITDLYMPKR